MEPYNATHVGSGCCQLAMIRPSLILPEASIYGILLNDYPPDDGGREANNDDTQTTLTYPLRPSTCSSSHAQSLSPNALSYASLLHLPTRAQGIKNCGIKISKDQAHCRNDRLTSPLYCTVSGIVPAHNCVSAPFDAGWAMRFCVL